MNELEIKQAIEARREELRPAVDEYERLQGAVLALKSIDAPRKPAAIIGHKPKRPELGRRYTRGEKEAAITMARRKGVGPKGSARTYGISEATIRRWLKAASKES
jgi:hypothetical protein